MKLFVKDSAFYKRVAVIAIPISLQSVITIGVNLADTVMVGALGENTLSATALANQFVNIFHICCMGIGMGASVLTARFWGMKDIQSLKKTITLMLRLCIGLATIVFMLPTIFAPEFLMKIYTRDAAVIAEGVLYYKWMIPCYLLQGLSLTCTIVLRSVGQVKIPLYSSIGAFFVNIFFNYVFIFGKLGFPEMGIEGAGIGTLIARFFEFAFICGYFFILDKKICYRIKDITMKCRDLLHDYITISLPVFVSDTLLALGNSAVAMVMGEIGKQFVSANSITVVTQQLSTVLIQGICHAGCIMTGHTLGEGDKEKAQEQAWTFFSLGVVIGAVAGGIILVISKPVIGMYNITEETRMIAQQLMNSIALIVVFQAVNSILTKGVLRGGGDTKFLMVADILFLWIVSVPFGALAGLVWHLDAFWIYFLLKLDQVIKAVWCVFRLKSGKWIKTISAKESEAA
ncbi:MAG: MATE family efflux transporter [Lachnospiraceae bacterium]|nr:MATE family efflux transporter [Lachnospiraceae bacterium]